MNKEVFDKLVNKLIMHFPSSSTGSCALNGYLDQEPYKSDLLRIFVEAFKSRNKDDQYELAWDRFVEDLYKKIAAQRPHISEKEIFDLFNQARNMWNEWLYIFQKIRGDHFTLVDSPNQSCLEKYGTEFIVVEETP